MLTPQQLEIRKRGIGGSDAAAVLGCHPYKSPLDLYFEKRGEVPPSERETEAMRWGTILEAPIAEEWAHRTGYQIATADTLFSVTHPWMLANLDRVILADPRGPGVLEIKAFGHYTGQGIESADDLPDYVYCQIQHELIVTSYTWAVAAILVAGQRLVWFEVAPHEEFQQALLEAEARFWERVQQGQPPDVDGTELTTETLKRRFPKDSGKTITLDHEAARTLATDLVEWKRRAKEAEEQWEARKNAIKMLMGDAAVLTIPAFGEFTWKASKAGSKYILDEVKLRSEFPEIYQQCQKKVPTGGSRTFLDKPAKAEAAAA